MQISTASTDFFVGDYCRVIRSEISRDVLLVFSAVGVPCGKFNGTSALKGFQANLIFLNCEDTWYITGIPELGKTLSATVERLGCLIKSLTCGSGKLFTYGGSMGGYGAILYGCLLEAELVIATGAELKLLIEGGATLQTDLSSKVDKKVIEGLSLSDIVRSCDTKIYLYYGENSYSDLVCGLEVLDCSNVRLISLKNFHHRIPPYLSETYGLKKFIEFHIENNTSFSFVNDESGDIFDCPALIRCIHSVVESSDLISRWTQSAFDSVEEKLGSFINSIIFSDNIKSHAAFGMSILYKKRGLLEKALLYSQKAIDLNSLNIPFWLHLIEIFALKNDFISLISASERVVQIKPSEARLKGSEQNFLKTYTEARQGFTQVIYDSLYKVQVLANDINLVDDNLSNRNCVITLEKTNPVVISIGTGKIQLTERCDSNSRFFKILKISANVQDENSRNLKNAIKISGILLPIKPEYIVIKLFAFQDLKLVAEAKTNIDSPIIAKKYAEFPHCNSARFRFSIRNPETICSPTSIRAVTRDGSIIEVGDIQLIPGGEW